VRNLDTNDQGNLKEVIFFSFFKSKKNSQIKTEEQGRRNTHKKRTRMKITIKLVI